MSERHFQESVLSKEAIEESLRSSAGSAANDINDLKADLTEQSIGNLPAEAIQILEGFREQLNKERKKKFSRRDFLKVVFRSAVVGYVASQTPGLLEQAVSYVKAIIKEPQLRREREQEYKKVNVEFRDLCAFYLKTGSSEKLDEEDPHSLDSEKNRTYLMDTLKKYLLITEEIVEEEAENPKVFFDRAFQQENDFELKKTLLERHGLVIEIQKILRDKLESAGENPSYLEHFVDGRLGPKSIPLCESITEYDYRFNLESLFSGEAEREELLRRLREGILEVVPINFEQSILEYAHKIEDGLKEYQITPDLRDDPKEIKDRMLRAITYINEEKRKLLKEATREEERIEIGKALMTVLVNYLVKAWEGSPARSRGGNAHYP